ncbi:cysteine proteinase [Ascoidea rubescens DSM 1968]|uniref:Cysteine proteinase n=1 Tax=Ascoidea rubescens DSM 1968 TaxID=1344418 RepID=A0A1D2VKT5_9ASCO|nr:cysteine proteinase [Ascoidea rubescens DSM 1968]ODV62224.1 cysteine proteinase [Ascoidea rubescens DSM 1968]
MSKKFGLPFPKLKDASDANDDEQPRPCYLEAYYVLDDNKYWLRVIEDIKRDQKDLKERLKERKEKEKEKEKEKKKEEKEKEKEKKTDKPTDKPTDDPPVETPNDPDDVLAYDKEIIELVKTSTSSFPTSFSSTSSIASMKIAIMKSFLQNNPVSNQLIIFSLISKFSKKDLTKSFELLRFIKLSSDGFLISNSYIYKNYMGNSINKKIILKGAENWGYVMCYLDSLLFSMFARLQDFEPILLIDNESQSTPESKKRTKLKFLLRLYINLLRSGNLITNDLTRLLCQSLAKNGYTEAISGSQEDSSSLFQFLTDYFNMPLLTLKLDIHHGGKAVQNDDHKFTKERVLYVSVPEDDYDKSHTRNNNIKNTGSINIINKSNNNSKIIEEEEFSTQSNENLNILKKTSPDNRNPMNESLINLSQSHQPNPSNSSNQSNKSNESNESNESSKSKKSASSNSHIDPEPILLEECLEQFFNTSIQVRRQLERRMTLENARNNNCTKNGGIFNSNSNNYNNYYNNYSDSNRKFYSDNVNIDNNIDNIDMSQKGIVTFESYDDLDVESSLNESHNSNRNIFNDDAKSIVSSFTNNDKKNCSKEDLDFLKKLNKKSPINDSNSLFLLNTKITNQKDSLSNDPDQTLNDDEYYMFDKNNSNLKDFKLNDTNCCSSTSLSINHKTNDDDKENQIPFPSLNEMDESVSPTTSIQRSPVTPFQPENVLLKNRKLRSSSLSKYPDVNITIRPRNSVSSRTRSSTLSIWSNKTSNEVTLPAWMFLQLLPFYTDLDSNSSSSREFMNKRPILPICLKRYYYDNENGKKKGEHGSKRNLRRVIIPPTIDLPKFIADDIEVDDNMINSRSNDNINNNNSTNNTKEESTEKTDKSEFPEKLYGDFKLILESAVCHRGKSVNSGHYISLVRENPSDPYTSEEEELNSIWLLFDDLLRGENKVRRRVFKDVFEKEWPYILFYRMVPFDKNKSEEIQKEKLEKLEKANSTIVASSLVSKMESLKIKISDNFNDSFLSTNSENKIKSSDNLNLKSEATSITSNLNSSLNSDKLLFNSQSNLFIEVEKSSNTNDSTINLDNSAPTQVQQKPTLSASLSNTHLGRSKSTRIGIHRLHHNFHDQSMFKYFKDSTQPYPNDPGYIDISNKFFWYVKVPEGNYINENSGLSDVSLLEKSSIISKDGESFVKIQKSDAASDSEIKSTEYIFEDSNSNLLKPPNEIRGKEKRQSADISIASYPSLEKVLSDSNNNEPTPNSHTIVDHKAKTINIFGDLHDRKSKKLYNHKKRLNYKKEKCIIT